MLYERWRQVALAWRDHLALLDFPTGRRWTFAELAIAAEAGSQTPEPTTFPHGVSAEFILSVLRAWRAKSIVCPLESGQEPPKLGGALPEGTVHLKTTSATTGPPRLVAFTGAQLMADAENIVSTMGLHPDCPNLGVISLAHSYGFSNLVLPLLLHGIPLILVGTALPEAVRRAAALEQAVTLAAVPALWRSWHRADAIPRNVRLAISAGAPLPAALEQEIFAARGLKVRNFYGSSECGGIAYDTTSGPRRDNACVGSALRNVQVSVGEDGCLEVRSRAVGQTYWPVASPSLGHGVFRTSDLAEVSFGLVYLRGRLGDQINVAGRKISPEVIERALTNYPEVRDCLVFGVPSAEPERGETIVACVVTQGGPSGEDMRQYLMTLLPAWQVPREWWLLDSLECSDRGKLSRAEFKRRYLEAAGRRQSPEPLSPGAPSH